MRLPLVLALGFVLAPAAPHSAAAVQDAVGVRAGVQAGAKAQAGIQAGASAETSARASTRAGTRASAEPTRLPPSGGRLLTALRRPGGDAQILTVASHALALRSELFPAGRRFSPWRALAKKDVPEGNEAGRGLTHLETAAGPPTSATGAFFDDGRMIVFHRNTASAVIAKWETVRGVGGSNAYSQEIGAGTTAGDTSPDVTRERAIVGAECRWSADHSLAHAGKVHSSPRAVSFPGGVEVFSTTSLGRVVHAWTTNPGDPKSWTRFTPVEDMMEKPDSDGGGSGGDTADAAADALQPRFAHETLTATRVLTKDGAVQPWQTGWTVVAAAGANADASDPTTDQNALYVALRAPGGPSEAGGTTKFSVWDRVRFPTRLADAAAVAVSRASGELHVFVRGVDGRIYTTRRRLWDGVSPAGAGGVEYQFPLSVPDLVDDGGGGYVASSSAHASTGHLAQDGADGSVDASAVPAASGSSSDAASKTPVSHAWRATTDFTAGLEESFARPPSAATSLDGRIYVTAMDTQGSAWIRWQVRRVIYHPGKPAENLNDPRGLRWSEWHIFNPLAGKLLAAPVLHESKNGLLTLFATLNEPHAPLVYAEQLDVNTGFHPWKLAPSARVRPLDEGIGFNDTTSHT